MEATVEAAEAEGPEGTAEGTGEATDEARAAAEPNPSPSPSTVDPVAGVGGQPLPRPARVDEAGPGRGAHILDGKDLWIRVSAEPDAATAARTPRLHVLHVPVGHRLAALALRPQRDQAARPAGGPGHRHHPGLRRRRDPLPDAAAGPEPRGGLRPHDQGRHRRSRRPGIDTVIPVYPGANWHEREAWEMYGITFRGHPHLVHIYLPGAFEGPHSRSARSRGRCSPDRCPTSRGPGIVDVEPMPARASPRTPSTPRMAPKDRRGRRTRGDA